MGKTQEALQKAEKDFLKKFGNNFNQQEALKSGRWKNACIGLLTLGLIALIIAGYLYDCRNDKLIVDDHKKLQNAQARIEKLNKSLTLKNHKLVEFEKQLYESEKAIKEEQKSKETQRTELLTNQAMVASLQKKLKAAQARHSRLKDEIFRSKIQIKALQVQLAVVKRKKASGQTPSPLVQTPQDQPKAAPSFNLQKDPKPDNSDRQTDTWGSWSPIVTPDLANRTATISTAKEDPFTTKRQPPDSAELIDWLIKKHAE